MTKISYIHGIPQNEMKDRGGEVPAQSFINYSGMTAGEMNLALVHEQLSMLAAFYPENREFQQGKSMLENALYRGIHGAPPAFGILSPGLQAVARSINKARRNNRPANGIAIVNRKSTRMGGIGDPLIPMKDCTEIVADLEGPSDPRWSSAQAAYKACVDDQKYVPLLNKYLEKSSYHLLYEFSSLQDASQYNPVSVKRVLHKAGTTTIHKITKVQQENLRLWLRNGVMRSNASKSIEPLQPEQSISILRENAGAGVGIDPITLIAIITAIAAAISAISKMVVDVKTASKNPYAFQEVQGIGTGPFGPEGDDWYVPPGTKPPGQTNEENGLSNLAIPLAIGAGALLLLN